MAILVDYSQVILASLFMSLGNHTNAGVSEDTVRHMFLNSLRANRKKFTEEYGEIVLCCDGKGSWRRDMFPYYKAARRKSREESELDWEELFRIISTIRVEIDEFFPYKVLQFDNCEADDIIGAICHEHGKELNTNGEKFLILSGDKDYKQLLGYANVEQYDPVRKTFLRTDNADLFLKEHIIRGDSGDGVPNILSAGNCLVVGERQKPITAKRLQLYLEGPSVMDETIRSNFERNTALIDLSKVPEHYVADILDKYDEEKTVGRSKLFNYFVKKRLKHLMTDIQDF